MDKELLRTKVNSYRRGLPSNIRDSYNKIIFKRFISFVEEKNIKRDFVFVYKSMPFEVSTKEIIQYLLSKGSNVCIPKIIDKQMFSILINNDTVYYKNRYGIEEPLVGDIVEPKIINCCVIPLVAFDLSGNRLGFGGGYYDRFLRKISLDCIKIGLAYDIQKVNIIPTEAHDVKMDYVITEKTIYY